MNISTIERLAAIRAEERNYVTAYHPDQHSSEVSPTTRFSMLGARVIKLADDLPVAMNRRSALYSARFSLQLGTMPIGLALSAHSISAIRGTTPDYTLHGITTEWTDKQGAVLAKEGIYLPDLEATGVTAILDAVEESVLIAEQQNR